MTEQPPIKVSKNEPCQQDDGIKVGSVHQLVQKIEAGSSAEATPQQELRSEVVIASNPEPSDDELTKGKQALFFGSITV